MNRLGEFYLCVPMPLEVRTDNQGPMFSMVQEEGSCGCIHRGQEPVHAGVGAYPLGALEIGSHAGLVILLPNVTFDKEYIGSIVGVRQIINVKKKSGIPL